MSSFSQVDTSAKLLVLPLASGATLTLEYASCPRLRIVDAQGRTIHEDLRTKGYCFEGTRTELARTATARASEPLEREGGLSWYSTINLKDVCMGLGEKAAPVNLARRRFELRTTNSAHYDAYNSDPLYKHLPFILFIPNPIYSGSSGVGGNLGVSTGRGGGSCLSVSPQRSADALCHLHRCLSISSLYPGYLHPLR